MHPLLFELSFGSWGVLPVAAFGALLAAAFGSGFVLTLRLAARAGQPRTAVLGACLFASFAGLLAARFGFVALHPAEVATVGEALSLANGGLSGSVGLAVGAVALVVGARRHGLAPASLLDAAAPGAALGVALTRLGCFLEGCDFGKPLGAHAPVFLARLGAFPHGSPAWSEQVVAQALTPSAAFALPVHPSELYEAALALGVAWLALRVLARQTRAGTTALFVLVAYAAVRVLVDFTRAPSPDVWCARGALVVALVVTASLRSPRVRAPSP
ncbi:MAG TPA: prolipoprotein diacylglyceryl transferase family protein [Polyangiaceae bacterium]|nr:prolipoprotein diacylglyceryl transferase family protein [Polyangiaceae bacterium]